MNQTIKFKENASPGKFNLGLESQGRSKFPGCVDIIQPGIGIDGRWKTGLDEYSQSISSITDSEKREKEFARIKAERESLEALTNNDLSGKSNFWASFFVEINPNVPLNLINPIDRIKYHVILANDSVAPGLKEAQMSEYAHAKYYIAREFEEVGDRLSRKKKYNEAAASLIELMKTPDKAVLIGKFLGLAVSNNMPQDNMYDLFQTYLDNNDKLGSVDNFLSAILKSPEEINIKLIYADAVKHNVIRQRDGLLQRGNITLGRTPEDAIAWLTDVKNSGELLSIQEEIENKRKFG